ncbi:MAG: tRNA (guanosine(46)-N7)-methyltransferase TrmB [Proteobacteria bacterium]|nr:tRNA (guanosine(46)-N7)-methyltransferase TrmB [Pseudomonadota bacterium]
MKTKRFKNPYIDEIAKFEEVISGEEDFLKRKSSFVYPVILDIGCGNGEVLVDLASKNPGKFYLGFELQYKEVYRTVQKIKKLDLKNCKVVKVEAEKIPELFDSDQICEVNIFFPDPWPKTRQKKNRLIKKTYIDALITRMRKESTIKIKTDNDDYFVQILTVLHSIASEKKIEILELTRDYHSSAVRKNEYITPFERIFLKQGFLINYICCKINDRVQ